ncbi:Gfo/Idh/MocA family oxidoreductase [Riemerella anatipestifer]|nr:Gfo/Idh/MocA family oxidoreductase [Riemerella anatipestifer]
MKSLVLSQKLGDIYMVQVNCFWNRDKRYYKEASWHGNSLMDGGVLYTQFSHFLDLLLWFFGNITDIQTKMTNFNHSYLGDFVDSGILTFDFVKGGMGVFNFSTSVWQQNLESSMTIIAEKGTIKVGGQYMDKVEVCHVEGLESSEIDSTVFRNNKIIKVSNHYRMLKDVVNMFYNFSV